MNKSLTFLLFLLIAVASASAQSIELFLSNETGEYARGETIKITANIADLESDTVHVKVRKNNNDTAILDKDLKVSSSLTVFEGSYDEACSLIVEVSSGETKDAIGAIVDASSFGPGSERPADFDAYWAEQRREILSLPFEVKSKPIELEAGNEGYVAFEVEINSPGPRPARAISPSLKMPNTAHSRLSLTFTQPE